MNTAARVGSINVVLNTSFGQGTRGLNTFADTVERTGSRTSRTVQGIDRSVFAMNRTMAGVGANSGGFRSLAIGALRTRDGIGQMNNALLATSALLGGLVPTLSGAYLLRMADRAQLAANNLRTVTSGTEDLKAIQQELFVVSQRSRSSLEGTAVIYSRLARATEAFGTSQEDLLKITETVNKSFAAGGANPQEAKGAAIQLTQGIASNRFSGDEFRSVAENAPLLLKGIADSLDVNIGKLREMAFAGELTAKVVTDAILKSSDDIGASFDKTVSTIGQATVKLDNAILQYVSNSDNVSTASTAFVSIINAVSENLDTVTDSLFILGSALAGTFVSRRVADVLAYNSALGKTLAVQRAATATALERARAEAAAAAIQSRSAAAAVVTANRGFSTQKTRSELVKASAAAATKSAAATARLTSATLAHSSAMQAASISGRAFASVGAIAQSAWAFIGGPFGAVLLAVGGAMYILQKQAQELETSLDRYNNVIEVAGIKSGGSADEIRKAASALSDLGEFASMATLQLELNKTQEDIENFGGALTDLPFGFEALNNAFENLTGRPFGEVTEELQRLGQELEVGFLTLDQYISKTDELASANPIFADKIVEAQRFAESLVASEARLDSLLARVEGADGTTATIDVDLRINTAFGRPDGTFDIQDRLNGVLSGDRLAAEINKKLEADRRDRGIAKPTKARKARKTDAQKQIERFQAALNKLDYRKATFGLSAIDEETIKIAKSAKVADSEIRNFINARENGGQLPESLKQIKMRLEEIAELEFQKNLASLGEEQILVFMSELDQETVAVARSFGVAEEHVKDFITAASSGDISSISPQIASIRTELEALTESERSKQFVDDLANAFGDFASSAILDFNNIGDSITDLVSRLAEMYVQMVLIEPLIKSISGGGGSGGPIGQLLSSLGGFLVPTNHSGGQAGVSNTSKVVSASALAGAQKFHSGKSGIGYNEVMALLEKSESVFTADDTARMAGALDAGMNDVRGAVGSMARVLLELSPELQATMMEDAKNTAIEINKKALTDFTRKVLPKESMKNVQKSVRAGKSIGGA